MGTQHPSVELVPAAPTTIEVDADSQLEAIEPLGAPVDRTSIGWHRRALRRHRWTAAGVLFAVLAGAAVFSLTVTPIYQAHAKLLVEPESPNVVAFKEVVDPNMSKLDYYETQIGILRSRSIARSTIDARGLWSDPELGANGQRRIGTRIMGWFAPGERQLPAPDETSAQSRAIDAFLARLRLDYRADNRLVDVCYRSADPRRAADVANTLAEVFIADKVALKLQASKAASDWLQARLAEQRGRIQASEDALQRYRELNPDVTVINQDHVAAQNLADLSTAAIHAKAERIDAEAVYAQLTAIQQNPTAADTLPSSLSNAYIEQLRADLAALQRDEATKSQRMGDRHPDMLKLRSAITRTQGQLALEVGRIAESVRKQTLALAEKERGLTGALEAQKRQVVGTSRKAIEYAALEREAASDRQLYQGLLQRAKEAELSSELNATNVRIVDRAEVPQTPVFPRRGLNMLLALVVGLPLAVGIALGRERLDDRIKSPEEITSGLRIRFLGTAPTVPKSVTRLAGPIVNGQEVPDFAEALRAIRMNVLLSATARQARTLLVTSTGPGEGKTLIASNLAVTLAQAGRRVLLVDADMRRAQLHTVFGLPSGPGLADVLQATSAMAEVVRPTTIKGLSILTAGQAPAMPGDLLQEHTFADAMASVRDQFEWIVIDSSPVMVAADAIALAQAATAVVFVIGAHMVNAHQAKVALDRLAPSGAKIIGAVLSRADDDRQSPYSYSRYAGYYKH